LHVVGIYSFYAWSNDINKKYFIDD